MSRNQIMADISESDEEEDGDIFDDMKVMMRYAELIPSGLQRISYFNPALGWMLQYNSRSVEHV